MNLKYTIISALESIVMHKMRSFLTVLGILIAVAAIISVMSMGRSATNLILSEINQLGASTIMVLPSAGGLDVTELYYAELFSDHDLRALERPANVPHIEDIMPAVIVPGHTRYRDETYRGSVVIGAAAEFFGSTFNVDPEIGSNFVEIDIRSRARVAVIGSRVREELFGEREALGQNITIGEHRFRVTGIYPPTGQRGPFNIDDLVIIPYTAAQTYLTGNNEFDRFIIRAESPEVVARTVFDIEATLRESRDIQPGEEDNFSVLTQQNLQDQISTVTGILTNFLIMMVSIALLVGGIGIMNIMLVSVTERTREIGLRKALGATRKAILKQFLWESVMLTLLGGILGILLGSLLSFSAALIISQAFGLDWTFTVPASSIILAISASAIVGLTFGLYPARQAAQKSPLEALQYE